MPSDEELHRMVALASRAKTKVKLNGHRSVCDLSADETLAMAYICDLFLEDYSGPFTRGEPVAPPQTTSELETS